MWEGKWLYLSVFAILAILTYHSIIYVIPLVAYFIYIVSHSKQLAWAGLIIAAACFGDAEWQDIQSSPKVVPRDHVNLYGKIITLPKIDGDQVTSTMRTDQLGDVLVKKEIKTEANKHFVSTALHIGMECQITGTIHAINQPGNFHQFNYQNFLENKGIYYEVEATTVNCQLGRPTFFDRILLLRQNGINHVTTVYPENLKGIVNALVFGDRSNLSPQTIEAYQSLGLIHLLAVSGLHVGVLTTTVFYLLIWLGVTREKAIVFVVIAIAFYMTLTGFSPSVSRAGLMMIMFFVSQLMKRRPPPLDVLSWSMMLLIAFNPFTLYDIGFQLSFTVTYGLILSYPVILNMYTIRWQQLLVVSLIAQVSAIPILLYHFYSFSPIGILLNLLYIPLFSICLLPLSFISVILSYFMPFMNHALFFIMSFLVNIGDKLLQWISNLPIATLTVGKPGIILEIIFIISIMMAFIFFEQIKGRLRYVATSGLIMTPLFLQLAIPYISPIGKVTFLDVGQGDSILIELPHRRGVFLIDTGGNLPFIEPKWKQRKEPYSVGRDVILNELHAKGIHHIDRLILTHRDYDHIGGLRDLIGEIAIDEIDISHFFLPTDEERLLFQKVLDQGTAIHEMTPGDSWEISGNQFYVLSPISNTEQSNNRSLVIYALIGGYKWLFTGDLEKKGEEELLQRVPTLQVDFLKVGHHGSASSTSETLLKSIHPKIGIISVGIHNRYGHPSQATIEKLHNYHVSVLRTDQQGAIEVTVTNERKGYTMEFAKFKSK